MDFFHVILTDHFQMVHSNEWKINNETITFRIFPSSDLLDYLRWSGVAQRSADKQAPLLMSNNSTKHVTCHMLHVSCIGLWQAICWGTSSLESSSRLLEICASDCNLSHQNSSSIYFHVNDTSQVILAWIWLSFCWWVLVWILNGLKPQRLGEECKNNISYII